MIARPRAESAPSHTGSRGPVSAALALPAGPVDLAAIPTGATPVGPATKDRGMRAMTELGTRLAGLQERLYAQSTAGDRRRVLVVLQGMDTAGKDGVINHVINRVDPGGVQLASFKKPTPEELAHEFLWRIERRLPAAGMIGVFNRSQYEDVLVVRVHEMVGRSVWSGRYATINAFERRLARSGVTIVKCFLHVSRAEQRRRLAARLDDPTKHWKYNPSDVDERMRWADYQEAYADALRRCHPVAAPWYVVPADRKWYRNWAVAALLAEALETIDPQYPPADFDVAAEKRRLARS